MEIEVIYPYNNRKDVVHIYCGNCGNKLSEEGKFCSTCGSEIERDAQQESVYISTDKDIDYVANNEKEKTKIRNISIPNFKSKWGIIGLTIVLVLAIGLMAKDYIIYAVSPELSIKLALNNTISSVVGDYAKMESLLFGYDKSNLSNSIGVDFTIQGANHTETWQNDGLAFLEGMGISLTSIFDDKNKELYLMGDYNISGNSLVSIDAKLDDNELLFRIPELFDEMLRIPSKNFGRDWNDSYIGQDMYLPVEDSLDISISNLQKTSSIEDMDDKTKNAYMNSLELIFKDAYYQKDGSINLMIGNTSKKSNKTLITLNEKSVKEGIIYFLDAIKSDNRVKKWEESFSGEFNYNEFEEAIESMKNDVMEYYEIDNITIGLFTNNGNVVKSEIQVVVDEDYEEGTLLCNIELLGNKSLIDDFKFEISVGNEGLTYESKGNHTGDKNIFVNNTKMVMSTYYGEDLRFESSTEIDFAKKKDNLKADIRIIADGGEIGLNTKGNFNSSSKHTEFQSDDIYFSYKDNYDEILKMNFSGLVKRSNDISNKPSFSDYEKLDLLKMEEYDLYNFASLIEEKAYWLGMRIEEELGY